MSNKGRQYDQIKMPRPCLYCLVYNHLFLILRLTKKLPKASVLWEPETPQQRFIFLHKVFFILFVEKRGVAEIRNYPWLANQLPCGWVLEYFLVWNDFFFYNLCTLMWSSPHDICRKFVENIWHFSFSMKGLHEAAKGNRPGKYVMDESADTFRKNPYIELNIRLLLLLHDNSWAFCHRKLAVITLEIRYSVCQGLH